MIPSEQHELIVGMLIAKTQSGALQWSEGECKGATLLTSTHCYTCRSDGLLFRLGQITDSSAARTSLFLKTEKRVFLDIVDEDDEVNNERLYEGINLPILRNLYEVVAQKGEPLRQKLNAFLGKKAG